MKKILLLGCILLSSTSISLAQTAAPVETPTEKSTTATPTVKKELTLDWVAKNIDRRLAYFNRYKQSANIEDLKKLISEQNKDFYTNFIKYVEASPLFTLKRDVSQKIIKTPLEEYAFAAIVSMDGKESRVSVTFVAEDSAQGTKWLISDSSLHVQPSLPKTKWNFASSVITKNPTTEQKPETSLQAEESKVLVTVPVVEKEKEAPTSTAPATATTTLQKPSSWPDMIILSSIGLICLLVISSVLFFVMRRKAQSKKAALLWAAATVAAAIVPLEQISTTDIKTEVTPVSNVTVSSVADAQTNTPILHDEVTSLVHTPSNPETISSPVVENIVETVKEPTPENLLEEITNTPIVASVETLLSATDTTDISSIESLAQNAIENVEISKNTDTLWLWSLAEVSPSEISLDSSNDTVHFTPVEESSVSAIFGTQGAVVQEAQDIKSLDQIISESSTLPLETHAAPHSLFDSILNPEQSATTEETHELFSNLFAPEDSKPA